MNQDEYGLWEPPQCSSISQWATEVKSLRGPMCEVCGLNTEVVGGEAHHVFPRSTHPEYELDVWNGKWVCEACHLALSAEDGLVELQAAWKAELNARACAKDDGKAYLQPWLAAMWEEIGRQIWMAGEERLREEADVAASRLLHSKKRLERFLESVDGIARQARDLCESAWTDADHAQREMAELERHLAEVDGLSEADE